MENTTVYIIIDVEEANEIVNVYSSVETAQQWIADQATRDMWAQYDYVICAHKLL